MEDENKKEPETEENEEFDSCDCSHCHHHCFDDVNEEIDEEKGE